ncbi:MAG: hypothetical protein HGA33_06470 [Candidatus Moranbacteria bacterium]|nr:hypothetical protein [Candidatus Moranbacteria bacterium]
MNFDTPKNKERMSAGRERLMSLEREGKYVFHGSPVKIAILEPRQAGGHDEETGRYENDGTRAVFASTYADCAIFRSLIHSREFENEMGINDANQLHFIADQVLMERAKGKIGYVYVLDKKDFGDFRGLDCTSKETMHPIEVVEVGFEDLPKAIKVVET